MSEASQDFVVGLSARGSDAALRLQRSFAEQTPGFAPADLIARIKEAFTGEGESRPRGYAPADAGTSPTEGWNPLDACAEPSPFIDPVQVAQQAGFDAGYAAAQAEHNEAAERDRALLARLVEAMRSDARIDRERLAAHLRQTVLHLVTRLVGETGVSGELLAARVKTATELLADASESAMLRVHPADIALLEGHLPATVFAIGDAQVTRGSFVMEAASTIVEDGPEIWLDQLARALDKIAVPKFSSDAD
ncbi:FliH/SctL family protein [Sphingomonas sp. TX0543]|uniref:FliH/SctL family protein n=1 Tax=unclassified Sphingomonas TaxID=196159 RepID=UPI0010F6A405|nr:FliH/SctL family protein [Sphingomonas sp. 3P27F8]